ncbi:MAG: hypothetical protein GX175_10480 [Halanaerobiaceae bacterium]|nr:hypothetical protein [Halanaerobiaceae bacterium]
MSVKIGIPRALMYHYYYPAWRVFFEELGLNVVLSPETNKDIIDQGMRIAVDDICLPFKVYYGHILYLKDIVDCLFVPRFISLGKYNYVCPKFMGLPDMLKANIAGLPDIIEPFIDLRKGIFPLRRTAHDIGRRFGRNYFSIERAYGKARKIHRSFIELQEKGIHTNEAFEMLLKNNNIIRRESEKNLNIAVLGHAYLLNDYFASMGIIKRLEGMGVCVRTVEMYRKCWREKAADKYHKRVFWYFNRQVMGAAYHIFEKDSIDGIVQVTAFGCGPDSLVRELIDIEGKKRKISIMNINIDEHSAEAGLMTRLEAFVDLIERRKMA